MRHAAYVLTLLVIWAASMAGLTLGLHDFLFGGPGGSVVCGWFIFGGAQTAAFATVSLAEEVAEILFRHVTKPASPPLLGSVGRLGTSKEWRISEHAA